MTTEQAPPLPRHVEERESSRTALMSAEYEARANRLRSQMGETVDELRLSWTPKSDHAQEETRHGADFTWPSRVRLRNSRVSCLHKSDRPTQVRYRRRMQEPLPTAVCRD